MKVLTEIGEICVHAGRDVLLRPSLSAIASLGEPREIVEIFARVMAGDFIDSLGVLFACADEDISDLFGFYDPGSDSIRYVPGTAPVAHVVPLAQDLMRHGVVGVTKPTPRREGAGLEYVSEFDARGYAAAAMAHLGLPERDAWNMTMTGLSAALQAKFPLPASESPGAGAPSKNENEANEAWHDRVLAAKAARKRKTIH